MIYIKNITDAQTILIPKEYGDADGGYNLNLYSTMTHKEWDFECTDTGNRKDYYQFGITLTEKIDAGEYIYTLTAGEREM